MYTIQIESDDYAAAVDDCARQIGRLIDRLWLSRLRSLTVDVDANSFRPTVLVIDGGVRLDPSEAMLRFRAALARADGV